jgi:hypothetical protein
MQYTEFPKALLVILLILGILHTQDMRVDASRQVCRIKVLTYGEKKDSVISDMKG